MSLEEWRDVPGYEGLYQVSSLGRVRSLPRVVLSKPMAGGGRQKRPVPPIILKMRRTVKGYLRVALFDKPRRRQVGVHRLICEAFHGPQPYPDAIARHLDDDRTNNTPANIAWGSRLDNAADAKRNGRYLLGERAPGAKLTNDQATELRRRRQLGEACLALAHEFGVSGSTVLNIGKGRQHQGVGQ
jgi:hypothetical protein